MASEPDLCDICAIVARDGWNSSGWHHCYGCHKQWKGVNKQHCKVCHETFSSPSASERHWKKLGHQAPAGIDSLVYSEERLCWQLAESHHCVTVVEISDANASEVSGQPAA